MKQQLSLLLLLVGCHLIAADDGIIDRCSMKCMQYTTCLENQASGKPESDTCMKPQPPCNCGPQIEIPPGDTKVAKDGIIHTCDLGCERYFKCLTEMPSGPCMMPSGCKCSQLPDTPIESKSLPVDEGGDLDDLHMPLMPNRGRRVCQTRCKEFFGCLSNSLNLGSDGRDCPVPFGCTCEAPPKK